jgi:hypothetical protein
MDNLKNNVCFYKFYILYYFLYYLMFYIKNSSCRWVPEGGNTVYYNEVVLDNFDIKPIHINNSRNNLAQAIILTQANIVDTDINTRLFSSAYIEADKSLIYISIKHDCGEQPKKMRLRYLVLFKSTYLDNDNGVVMYINFLTVTFSQTKTSYVAKFDFPGKFSFKNRPSIIARLQTNESFQHSISIQNVTESDFSFVLNVPKSVLSKLKFRSISEGYKIN